MKTKDLPRNLPVRHPEDEENRSLPGYPLYPESEDIYSKSIEEQDINPEDISNTKESNGPNEPGTADENEDRHGVTGIDLDIPGSELDDKQELVGSEDEENNYYSLGGDDHNGLDEDDTDHL